MHIDFILDFVLLEKVLGTVLIIVLILLFMRYAIHKATDEMGEIGIYIMPPLLLPIAIFSTMSLIVIFHLIWFI